MCGLVVFVKQKTAYEMRISDWSSDVCSSDLLRGRRRKIPGTPRGILEKRLQLAHWRALLHILRELADPGGDRSRHDVREHRAAVSDGQLYRGPSPDDCERLVRRRRRRGDTIPDGPVYQGSEEHTSELQSLMRISYAVFCLKKK